MDNQKKDEILGKIKKLMMLGMKHEDTPEGKSALDKANALMKKYDIRFVDVEDDGTIQDKNIVRENVPWNKHRNGFEAHLANCIAENLDCRYVTLSKGKQGSQHCFVGTNTDTDLACWLFKFTRLQCYRLSEKQSYTGKDLRTYFFGMYHTLSVKVESTFGKIESEKKSDVECTALIVVKKDAVNKKTTEIFPNLKNSRKAAPLKGSMEAFLKGNADGKKVSVQRNITE